MGLLAKIFLGIIAFEELFILWIEVFAWEAKGPKVFSSFKKEFFGATTSLASNMGLYNGFLGAGMIWSLFIKDAIWSLNIALFFTGCMVVAGIYGALTVEKGILFKQGIPAMVTLLILLLS